MRTRLFILMGVAGCGKTSIGEDLAARLNGIYIDGDDHHPKSNIEKMASGQPLSDTDRWPWLKQVAQSMSAQNGLVFAGCSSLKKSYRSFLIQSAKEPIQFIYLEGSKDLIGERMKTRDGHFMPPSMLDSQFATLEVPDREENAIFVDISGTKIQVVDLIEAMLRERFLS